MTTPAVDPTSTTPAAGAEGKTPKPATPAGAPKPDKAPAPTPAAGGTGKPPIPEAQKARQTLDQVTAQRKAAAQETARLEKLKAEVAPLSEKAKELTELLTLLKENPVGYLEKFGIPIPDVTQKLVDHSIAETNAKTPDGRIDKLEKELEEDRKKAATEKETAAKQEAERQAAQQKAGYVKTITDALTAEKFPLTASLGKIHHGDALPEMLWRVGGAILQQRFAETKQPPEKYGEWLQTATAPTPEEILTEAEKYYADGNAPRKVYEKATTVVPTPEKDKTPEQIKEEAVKSRKSTSLAESDKPKAPPLGDWKKPETTLAQRKKEALAKAAKKKP